MVEGCGIAFALRVEGLGYRVCVSLLAQGFCDS